jgi:putative ABC transport system permease protein
VAGFYKVTSTDVAPLVTDVTKVREIVEKNTPGLVQVLDRGRGWCKVTSGTATVQAGLSGIDIQEETRILDVLQLAPESAYKTGGSEEKKGDIKRLSEPNSVVVFAGQAKRLGVEVGDELTLQTETSSGRTNTADITIVAIVEDMGLLSSWSMFVPKQVIRELYQLNEDTTGAVWIYLEDINQAEAVMDHLREVFAKEGYRVMDHEGVPFFMKFEGVSGEDWTGQAIDITIWKDEVSFLSRIILTFDVITWFLVTILVVIIAVGIMNTMWNAVRERTREVGTLRAIGMYRWQVLVMFLLEAATLGLFATTVGALVGAGLALGLDAAHIRIPIDAMKAILLSDVLRLTVVPLSLLKAVVALTFFTTLSALWPSLRAASLRPVVALSHAD